MKDVTNELFISVHMVKEKNLIEEIQYKIKYGIFCLFYLLLKNQDINLWVEVICIIRDSPSNSNSSTYGRKTIPLLKSVTSSNISKFFLSFKATKKCT